MKPEESIGLRGPLEETTGDPEKPEAVGSPEMIGRWPICNPEENDGLQVRSRARFGGSRRRMQVSGGSGINADVVPMINEVNPEDIGRKVRTGVLDAQGKFPDLRRRN